MNSLKSFEILKTTREFSKLYKKASTFHNNYFVVFYEKSTKKKVGFVASKKVGNAVCRNRCKRVLREVFKSNLSTLDNMNYSFIFVAKQKLLTINSTQAQLEFKKINIFKN